MNPQAGSRITRLAQAALKTHNTAMKRIISSLILVLSVFSLAHATPFGDFNNKATSADLKPFALDLGAILGGAAFHSGRTLGFPGVEAGVVATVQSRPDKDDLILRSG